MAKVWAVIKKFLFDLFTDIRGAVDEKRFWGNVLMALGVVVVLANLKTLGPYTWITAGGLFGFGIAILGIAAHADSQIGGINVPSQISMLAEKIGTIVNVGAETESEPPAKDGA